MEIFKDNLFFISQSLIVSRWLLAFGLFTSITNFVVWSFRVHYFPLRMPRFSVNSLLHDKFQGVPAIRPKVYRLKSIILGYDQRFLSTWINYTRRWYLITNKIVFRIFDRLSITSHDIDEYPCKNLLYKNYIVKIQNKF